MALRRTARGTSNPIDRCPSSFHPRAATFAEPIFFSCQANRIFVGGVPVRPILSSEVVLPLDCQTIRETSKTSAQCPQSDVFGRLWSGVRQFRAHGLLVISVETPRKTVPIPNSPPTALQPPLGTHQGCAYCSAYGSMVRSTSTDLQPFCNLRFVRTALPNACNRCCHRA